MTGLTAELTLGQRWISDTESELGLGVVVSIEHRLVTIVFPACEEKRTYAIGNAPLSRVRFSEGDEIDCDDDEKMTVTDVDDDAGLLIYQGTLADGSTRTIDEMELSAFIQFSQPQDRLFAGKIDSDHWFQLRYRTQTLHEKQTQSKVFGLSGVRTALIKHQLYIAHEVAHRYAPRVLLADEVGLGKTIEAGLILHNQLLTHRIQRVLIIVPDSLCFQWLVEMLRRFNLSFSLFDEERCSDFDLGEDDAPEDLQNPFLSEQLILCSQLFLMENPHRQAALLDAEWDTLVVDEAHHLAWSETHVSDEYALIAALALKAASVLLLTATPEQLGRDSHFARLRLLDPERFHSLAAFIKEEADYEPVADVAESLVTHQPLKSTQIAYLHELLGAPHAECIQQLSSADTSERTQAREAVLDELLDRHGTGRALFRNTRKTIAGFPQRQVHGTPLELPEIYHNLPATLDARLHPERQDKGDAWCQTDPRLPWLQALLKSFASQKVLLICAAAQTVLDLEQALTHKLGQRCAVFHEGMSIVQRDRAAAYFADDDTTSAQILLCSEIGSEGRNFQFSHHLVLFDLPLNPDLLEQRIGRLDRIGQTSTIQIHVPYFKHSAQQLLFQWYQQGLGAFEQTCPAGQAVFSQLGDELQQHLLSIDPALETEKSAINAPAVADFLQRAHTQHKTLDQAMQRGRDHLLELSSCRTEQAERLIEGIKHYESADTLRDFMRAVCDQYGIDFEVHSTSCYILRPGGHMLVSALPNLPEEGATVTFDRQTALSREELMYLTWEHPMVLAAMELILNDERGNTSAVVIDGKGLKLKQTLFLETLFVIECQSPPALQLSRFFPTSTIRLVLDEHLKNHASVLSHALLNKRRMPARLNKAEMRQVVQSQKKAVTQVLKRAKPCVEGVLETRKANAIKQMIQHMKAELQRLTSLQRVNPNIRDEEIEHLKQSAQDMLQYIQQAKPKLDAVRLVFITE